ncbi:MAG: nuclear transport factor 2 family protein [Betaproteobacteria bacterium]
MSAEARRIVEEHWRAANARDWDRFAALLHPQLRYEVPQTREYIDNGAGYLDLFRTWPGNWSAHIGTLVCEGERAVCIIDFAADGETMTGLSVFELADGRIASVTDYWPAPYEPPPRQTPHFQRRSQ